MRRPAQALIGALLLSTGSAIALQAPQPGVAAPGGKLASAVFAGGCFWSTEYDFDKVPGVVSTTSGFAGGRVANPSYAQVSAGDTGHFEAVRVVYDPSKISYPRLVAHFFRTVDPLDGGGQFCDRGGEYRTAIFVASPGERRVAEATKARAAALLGKPIALQIRPAAPFYAAEAYHQDYHQKNPAKYKDYRRRCGRDAYLAKVWSR